ncbi:hypothetical protein OIU77_008794 [Salix suchowensis]|uniref:Bifunctional inhibitor/plant lipid transfer protein/seed storage helical domain-containing protein n=1 Tax=Salix suchowensis TaxID=1278906 RepID=A0ABQ9AEF4_9ROSI|nr:hypothetical protein OIU77_008794 [Salix suchowensis]
MARFFIVAAALASLLLALVANASSYRTTITTVEFDDQPRLALRGIHGSRGDQGRVQQCCEQIRQVDRQCQCDALRSMIKEQTRQQRPEQEEMQEAMRRATEIQRQCGMPDCQSESIWF